ncbi:MAG: metal-dependent hydrolase [Candidatus Bathyarchaeales archaeon]
MKLLTHTAFGLFLGTLFYYFLDLDFGFVFLTGFAAFLPDIDWRMQISWHMGNVHRKVLHNLWFLIVIMILTYLLFNSLFLTLGIVIGFVSHLIADSFTIKGVFWLYPLGKDNKKYFLNGPLNMDKPIAITIEKYVQIILFASAGLLFLIKEIAIENLFSLEGIITIAIIISVGFYSYKVLAESIKRIIRRIGL